MLRIRLVVSPPALVQEALAQDLQAAKHTLGTINPHDKRIALHTCDTYAGLKQYGITNAWLKMWEMSKELDMPSSCVFFNCEFPGAFVASLQTRNTNMTWCASSIMDDGCLQDSYHLYRDNPTSWIMDQDVGDVTKSHSVRALAQRCLAKFKPTLYVSDGATDIGNEFDREEELNAHIHLGQVTTGLLVMRPGASLLVKTFTMFGDWSRAIVHVLRQSFVSVEIVKPVTSRPCNSEVYLWCTDFIECSCLDRLVHALDGFDYHCCDLPAPLDESLADAISVLVRTQVVAIREACALGLAGNPHSERRLFDAVSRRAQKLWQEKFGTRFRPTP
jgi:hypothetical protein